MLLEPFNEEDPLSGQYRLGIRRGIGVPPHLARVLPPFPPADCSEPVVEGCCSPVRLCTVPFSNWVIPAVESVL